MERLGLKSTLLICALFGPAEVLAEPTTNSRAAAPSSDDRSEAQTVYRQALGAYDARRYHEALRGFVRAYELAPSFRIQYNIGMVNVLLADHAGALVAFERYLKEGGSLVPLKRVEEVQQRISALSGKVGTLDIVVDVQNARVLIDDVEVGKTPLSGPVRLNEGTHRISVLDAGREPHRENVRTVPGQETTLHIRLGEAAATPRETVAEPRESVAPPKEAPEPQPKAENERSNAPWIAWAVTGALGVGAATTGILALSARSDEKDVQRTQGIQKSDLDDSRSKVKSLSLATDILIGATAVAAGISLYLTLGRSEKNATANSAALVIAPGNVRAQFTF